MLDWLGLLRRDTDRFAVLVETAALDAPVEGCPGWRLHDLVDHLGGVHQWAAHAVVAGSPELQPEPAGSLDARALAEWYRGHATALIDVLASRPADAPAWTLDRSDRTAGFWRRRQVHETRLHRWDVELTAGEPASYDVDLAWDGVLEVAEVLYPRQVRLGRVPPLDRELRLVAADGAGRTSMGAGEPVQVRADAEVLLRLLWHRADPVAEDVDPRAGSLLAGALTP